MIFEEIILKNSPEQISKLYEPAKRASVSPDTGISGFTNKSAPYVIRDTAKIARLYLPLHVWSLFEDPLTTLRGKFTREAVEDFLRRTKKSVEVEVLKRVIVSEIREKYDVDEEMVVVTNSVELDVSGEDIYSYYGDEDDEVVATGSEQESLSDDELILRYMC
jgi:hypothetical protein